MTPSNAAADLVRRFEGLRLHAYQCPAGKWTIGYGSTFQIQPGMTITAEQAESLLRRDLLHFGRGVLAAVTCPLGQNQLDALTSFTFNVGISAFRGSTMRRRLNSGDYAGAAAEFDRWVFGGGRRLPGLVARRAAERSLFEAVAASRPTDHHQSREMTS